MLSCALIAAVAIASCNALGNEAMRGLFATIVTKRSSAVAGAGGDGGAAGVTAGVTASATGGRSASSRSASLDSRRA